VTPGRTIALVLHEVEFIVEPFVDGQPGPHVRAAVDAATEAGAEVDFGPFGSTGRAAAEAMPDVVAAITRAAFENGATHVTLHVASAPRVEGEQA
jgi:uncharacterized protein YqgV (UPF0045/DUF77 family)